MRDRIEDEAAVIIDAEHIRANYPNLLGLAREKLPYAKVVEIVAENILLAEDVSVRAAAWLQVAEQIRDLQDADIRAAWEAT